ncbi:MAG: FkbM family methyltransferase [Oscillatoria princeps RMCB-10]|jgi:FkbM family methyltransferase|nr:FkbM family methyltransferase [Oscillatoria princeps RMCB-10]
MRRNVKIFHRIVKAFLLRKLGFQGKIFSANQAKLDKAKQAGRELVDIMPGILLPMVIHPDMYFRLAYTDRIFEPASIYFIRDYLRPGQTVLDVGANTGYFSLLFSQLVGSKGQVIAFEPSEFSCGLLRRNRDLNNFTWLEIHQFGLGEENAIVNLNVGEPGMDVYNSLGKIVHPCADYSKFRQTPIQIFKGDDWLEQNKVSHIHFMKLDVEGGEYSALKGMRGFFKAQKVSMLLIEITYEMSQAFGYTPSDIISMLRDFGYDWFELKPYGRLVRLEGNIPENSGMFVAVVKDYR